MESTPAVYLRKTHFHGDHATTMVNRFELYEEILPHGHDFFEIALAAGGSGEHLSAAGRRSLTAGDIIIVRPGAWHGYTRCQGLVIHNCCFDQQLLQRELSWLREDPALNYLMWAGPYSDDRRGVMVVRIGQKCLEESLEGLYALGKVQSSRRRAETLGRLLVFLDGLACSVDELHLLSERPRPFHPAVLETMRLLENHLAQDWSLSDLALRCHLDPSYLVRLFKAEIGLAPIAYLNRCRVERAAGLMVHTLLPVAEVAAQVGWYDPNLFARRFRMAYGMSPSEYRKRFSG